MRSGLDTMDISRLIPFEVLTVYKEVDIWQLFGLSSFQLIATDDEDNHMCVYSENNDVDWAITGALQDDTDLFVYKKPDSTEPND